MSTNDQRVRRIGPVEQVRDAAPSPATVLNALSDGVVVVDGGDRIRFANPAAEQLFQTSASALIGMRLTELMPADHPLVGIVEIVRRTGGSTSEHGIGLDLARVSVPSVSMTVSPLIDDDGSYDGGSVVVSIAQLSIAQKIDQQLTHRNSARSIAGMAAILAHEVKNPLAGIRGAAQLIEQSVGEGDRELTRLICDETDRICALVDRMGIFSEQRMVQRGPVNIHEVLEHARKVAQTGFGRHVRFVELYDPSLPPVLGNRDQLVQVMLNLIKNACDAVPADVGEIVLGTAYRHGVRLAMRGSAHAVDLPIVVSVQDNGGGVPEDLRNHLFDPFVTTKRDGQGLGLALVAKIVGDHGGVIEFDSEPRGTVFRVLLPVCHDAEPE
jgi:two-component system, NtrC family, nitrogen regulation sensor histidine kinase GlnL